MPNAYPSFSQLFRYAATLIAAIFLSAPLSASGAENAVAAPCSARQLGAFDAGSRDYGERRLTRIELIDNSSRACSLQGYPRLRFQLLSGAQTFVPVRKTPHDAHYSTPGPTTIALGSLRRASFLLGYPKTRSGPDPCVAVSSIGILFGGANRYGTVALPDTIYSCGTVNVSPFFRSKERPSRS